MATTKFSTPDVSMKELEGIKKVLDTRWLTNGPVVTEFENMIKEISKCDHAVCVDSCTAALEFSLRMLGIGYGDEVITTPYTYSATAEVIHNVGARIVFVDLQPDSFEMDYEKVADAITERTKAIIPVDIGGVLCDYESLYRAIESKQELFIPNNPIQESLGRIAIVEDAAHAFYASREICGTWARCGELADFTCYSFHVLKNITTGGEGGGVVWKDFHGIDNAELETRCRLIADHGQTSRNKENGWEYDIALFGFNSIMTNIDAACGIEQLKRFDEINKKRIYVTRRYDTLFAKNGIIKPMIDHFKAGQISAYHLYPVAIGSGDRALRDAVYLKMKEAGIPCNVHYKPLPMMTAYKNIGFDIKDFQNAYNQFAKVLTIPYHTELLPGEQDRIVETLEKAVM